MDKIMPRTRFGAFLIHLSISSVLLFFIYLVLFFWWFPGGLFYAAGGWEGLRIVAAVDIVLGPALTLLVCNMSKSMRELIRDLSCVMVVQFLSLCAGIFIVYHARPLVVVQVFDTFYALNRESMEAAAIDDEVIKRYTGFKPYMVYVPTPLDRAEFLSQHVKGLLNGAKPQQLRAEEYRDLGYGAEITPLLHGVATPNKCIKVDIESYYREGKICFDPDTHGFSDFEESK